MGNVLLVKGLNSTYPKTQVRYLQHSRPFKAYVESYIPLPIVLKFHKSTHLCTGQVVINFSRVSAVAY